jgi:hypothetical protein
MCDQAVFRNRITPATWRLSAAGFRLTEGGLIRRAARSGEPETGLTLARRL